MYNIIRHHIENGGYRLSDVKGRIKKLYAMGDLTEEQMDELLNMAEDNTSVDFERPETLSMLRTLTERMDSLEARIRMLEGGAAAPEEGDYPDWKAWDGLSGDYKTGAIVRHNGMLWESVYAGQNVWEPGCVSERLWRPYSE